MWIGKFLLLVITFAVLFRTSSGQIKIGNFTYHEDDVDQILSSYQKAQLDKFRPMMTPFLKQEQDYMKTDLYLVKFLKVNDFDIPSASRMLKDNLAWRKENRLSTVLEEDFRDLTKEYKFVIDGCDYEGRPTAVGYVGDWDLQKLVVAGKSKHAMRYVHRIYEEANIVMHNMQKHGSNATRANLILNVEGFNLRQHFCPGCFPIMASIMTTALRRFPLTVNFLIVVNTPQAALPIWDLIKPLMPKKSQDYTSIYGKNRNEWRKALYQKHRIDVQKMSKDMGGTGPNAVDFYQIKDNGNLFMCP